jgi:hypothetical protein
VTFRWIEGEELELLRPVIEAHGWTPLDPIFAKALIAEDEEGNLAGFNVLQVVLRPEPLWVAKRCRGEQGEELAMQLAEQMTEYLRVAGATYWEIKAASPFVGRLCEANGMKKMETPMYVFGERE